MQDNCSSLSSTEQFNCSPQNFYKELTHSHSPGWKGAPKNIKGAGRSNGNGMIMPREAGL